MPSQPSPNRYRQALWLLTKRDLRVRYSTSALGYLWSILEPLLMAGIYFFVFVIIFKRGDHIGEQPYIIFLLSGLLPWMWFNGTVSDCTRAFLREAKLIRSTKIPRSIWVNRLVLSKGIEYVASLPVLAAFAIGSNLTGGPHASLHWQVVFFPLGIVMQAVLLVGIGLIIAPLVVFFRDLERAIKVILRFMLYASPVIYGVSNLPESLHFWAGFNPFSGVLALYRAAFFPSQLQWHVVITSTVVTLVVLGIGIVVFRRMIRSVLKEI